MGDQNRGRQPGKWTEYLEVGKEEQMLVWSGGSLAESRVAGAHHREMWRPFWGWPGLSETASQPPQTRRLKAP